MGTGVCWNRLVRVRVDDVMLAAGHSPGTCHTPPAIGNWASELPSVTPEKRAQRRRALRPILTITFISNSIIPPLLHRGKPGLWRCPTGHPAPQVESKEQTSGSSAESSKPGMHVMQYRLFATEKD